MRFYGERRWNSDNLFTNRNSSCVLARFVCCHFVVIENFIADRLSVVDEVEINLKGRVRADKSDCSFSGDEEGNIGCFNFGG